MAALAHAIALKAIETLHASSGSDQAAVALMGDEWAGMGIDFITNSYAVRVSTGAEKLFGSGPGVSYSELGVGLDFTDNSSALKV